MSGRNKPSLTYHVGQIDPIYSFLYKVPNPIGYTVLRYPASLSKNKKRYTNDRLHSAFVGGDGESRTRVQRKHE